MYQRLQNIPKSLSFFLLGPRQTGKTTLLNSIFAQSKDIFKVNLVDEKQYYRYLKDPSRLRGELLPLIRANQITTVLIDEVQRIPAILNEVQLMIDEYRLRFVLSGSSARKLKRGGANLLGGRAVIRHLFPLTKEELGDDFSLENVLRFGSLPRIITANNDEERIDLLRSYVHIYLREEIQAEGIVRNMPSFSRFLDVAAQQSGELLNYEYIGKEAGLPSRTVRSYYEILEETMIGFKLEAWVRSVRKRMRRHPKFYLFDLGVLNALLETLQIATSPVLRGKLFEHFIILESFRLINYFQKDVHLYFWHTKEDQEVDLIFVKHGEPILAVEIKSSSNVTDTALKGLGVFKADYPNVECCVVAPIERSFILSEVNVLSIDDFLAKISELN